MSKNPHFDATLHKNSSIYHQQLAFLYPNIACSHLPMTNQMQLSISRDAGPTQVVLTQNVSYISHVFKHLYFRCSSVSNRTTEPVTGFTYF